MGKRLLAVAITAGAVLAGFSAGIATAGTQQVYWRSIRNPSFDVVRPHNHLLLSDRKLRNMRWSRWGPDTATGRGDYVATCYFLGAGNSCVDWVLPVKLSLSRVRTCSDGRRIFTRLAINNPLPGPSASGYRAKPYRPLILTYDCRGRSRGEGTVGTSANAIPGGGIRVYKNPAVIQGLAIRPSQLTLAADGNYTITGLHHWKDWGSATARANGINHVNNCVPDCANGHISHVPVKVQLSSPGHYRGHYIYRCYAVKPAAVAYLRHFCLP
jgi:hypothetical protein